MGTTRRRARALALVVAISCSACGGSVSTGPSAGTTDSGTPSDGGDASTLPPKDSGVDADVGAVDANPQSYTSCEGTNDCDWGEIDHEILSPADCICRYGCAWIPMNKTTNERREKQYAALCDPQHDGQGNPCGIDDCISPPPITCVNGQCAGPSKDY
jgi:hypothetical protein